MQICVIKNTEPKNTNIGYATVAGGLTGLALRQFVPPPKEEIDAVMFNQVDMIKESNLKSTKNSVIEKAEKLFAKNPEKQELELFLERAKAQTAQQVLAAKQKIKSADSAVKKEVKIMIDDLAGKIKASKNLSEMTIKNYVKHKRPVAAILLPSMALGAVGAFVYNVLGKINED